MDPNPPLPVSIRSRLVMLVLSVLLPGLLGAAWIIANTVQAERDAHERSLRDAARALSAAVDGELSQRVAVARVLAQSSWLDDAPDLTREQTAGIERLARRAMSGLSGWVVLRSADRVLLDTRQPTGVPPVDHREALATAPMVEAVGAGDDAHVSVIEPVSREGQVRLNLQVSLRPQDLQRVVDAQDWPAGWVGTVTDSRGVVVARHAAGPIAAVNPGPAPSKTPVATALATALAAATEGVFERTSPDGQVTLGYATPAVRELTSQSEMPRDRYDGLTQRAVVQAGVGFLGLLLLAVVGALWVSRGIVGPLKALQTAVVRLQNGQPVPAGSTGITDYDELTQALATAAAALSSARTQSDLQVAEAIARTRQAEQRLAQGQRVEALGRLTGGVAHDLNNLLGIISNSAHLIGRHPAAPELDAPLGATHRAVQTGHQLTQHLLRFAGRRPVAVGPLDLGRYLPDVLELIRSTLGRRIKLVVQVAPDTVPVLVDAGGLDLALINLALNARGALPDGGELRLSARNATDADREDFASLGQRPPTAPMVLITVSDDGVGMAPEAAAHVFEPFFTTKPFGRGSGMGLSQVHGLCTQSGGAVRLASTPGLGTTVLMLLPAADQAATRLASPQADDPAACRLASPQAEGPGKAALIAGARVLLVEDNETLADVTELLLNEHGAQVQRAQDARQALRLVAAEPAFDAVLTDVVMPGDLDGLGLARRLRQDHPALTVVIISGYNTAESASGFPVLCKPCPPDELLAVLGQAVATTVRRRAEVGIASPASGR